MLIPKYKIGGVVLFVDKTPNGQSFIQGVIIQAHCKEDSVWEYLTAQSQQWLKEEDFYNL